MEVIEQTPTSVTRAMRLDTNADYDLMGILSDGSSVTIPYATRGACSHGALSTTQDFLFLYALEGVPVDLGTRYLSARAKYEGLHPATWTGTLDVPSVGRVEIGLDGALLFRPAASLTYAEFERHIVQPFSTLLTFLLGAILRPSQLVLETEAGQLVTVRRRLRDQATAPANPALEPSWLSLKAVGAWYRIWDRLIPVPSVIAKTVARDDLDVELRILSLAASVEAIHRELYDHETMTKAAARAIRKPALQAVPSDARARVEILLSNLRELTYAERLRELTDRLGALSDELAGSVRNGGASPETSQTMSGRELWITAIKDARNGFAHQVRRSPEDLREYAGRMFTLYESLRWFTAAVLLFEMGIAVPDISNLFKRSSAYHLFRERASHHWPEVYEETSRGQ